MIIRRRSSLFSATALAVALTVGTGALAAPSSAAPPGSQAAVGKQQAKSQKTRFAFTTSGYGTRLRGGAVPVGSATTSYQAIGCTNVAGLKRTNVVAEAELPGVGTVTGVKTRLRTFKKGGATKNVSLERIASVVVGEPALGTIAINAIKSRSRAWHDAEGFHSDTLTQIGSIALTPPGGGEPQALPLPTPDQPIEIPGLLKISVGKHKKSSNGDGAAAMADTVKIVLVPSGTRLRVAHTTATIARGVKSGLFGGSSYALRGTALDELVELGRQPLSLMPCQGTRGEVREKALAGVDIEEGPLVVNGLTSRQKGVNKNKQARGFEESEIAEVNLGDQLVITAIRGRANVVREGRKLKANIKGTEFGSITANGEPQTFPDSDVIEIPGLVTIERNVTKRTRNGISVVSLRLTLLDGTGAVIDLGTAKMYIRRSGR